MIQLFNTILYTPIVNALIFLYHGLGNSFGLAIIALTIVLRGITIPLTIPALKSQKKMQGLQPELAKLKKKHLDKKQLQMAQLEFYKQHGVNPGAGCLPQILQIIVLIALYQAFLKFINGGQIDGATINMRFLWLDLSKSDPFYILPVLAGLTQLIYSFMLRPGIEHPHSAISPKSRKSLNTPKQQAQEKDMAEEIQGQMTFMMPIMTVIISLKFPSGLALYWVITTVFSVVQQWFITGPGGLKYYWVLAKSKLGVS